MNEENSKINNEFVKSGRTGIVHGSTNQNIAVLELSTKAVKLLTGKQSLISKNGFDFSYFHSDVSGIEMGSSLNEESKMNIHSLNIKVIFSINEMLKLARKKNVDTLYAVATGIYRIAKNREEIIERIRNQCGINVKILNSREEAVSTLLGFFFSKPKELKINPNENFIMIDQGGGSTEISLFSGKGLKSTYSLDLGTAILIDIFKKSIKTMGLLEALTTCEMNIKEQLNSFYHSDSFKDFNLEKVNGLIASGTAITLAAGRMQNAEIHGQKLDIEHFYKMMNKYTNILDKKYNELGNSFQNGLQTRGSIKDSLNKLLISRLGIPMFLEIMQNFNLSELIMNGTGLRYGIYFQQLYEME